MLKRLAPASVLVVLVVLMASGASAFTSDKRTYFTFSQPVALPGVTLPAGTYLFRLADETTTRRVVQVANRAGNQSYAMLHTIQTFRADPPRDPEIRFMETAEGQPPAVEAYWLPGESIGYGFLYSKEQLEALRTAAPAAAAAPIEEDLAEEAEAEAEAIEPPEPAAAAPEVTPEVEPEARVAQAPAGQPPAQQPEAETRTRETLPETASPLALLLLAGVTAASVGARMLRKS